VVSLDEQEVKIIRGLIRNPRISDNQLSKGTGIPVMSVNRKRKRLEEKGLINYYTDFAHGERGTQDFLAKQLYIIKFLGGITREQFLRFVSSDHNYRKFMSMYAVESYLGEKDGRLALIIILNGKNTTELVESFNSTVMSMFREHFGENSVRDIITARITDLIRTHHNYLPIINMDNGVMKQDWPDDYIFVSRDSYGLKEHMGKLSDY